MTDAHSPPDGGRGADSGASLPADGATLRERVHGRFAPFSDFEVESFLVGELEPARARALEEAAAENRGLAEHLQRRRNEKAAFALEFRPLGLEPVSAKPRRSWMAALPLLAASAAAALFFLPAPDDGDLPGAGRSGVAVARGSLSAKLICERDGRVFEHRPGVYLREHDRLRVAFFAPRTGFVHLVGTAASGDATVFVHGHRVREGDGWTPGALKLDDARGPERLTLLFSPEPASAAAARAAVGKLPSGWHAANFVYEKEPAP